MSKDIVVPIGLDNGCGTSEIASVNEFKQPHLMRTRDGYDIIDSAVYLAPDGKLVVGPEALSEIYVSPERVARFFKRKMGTDEVLLGAGTSRELRARDLYGCVIETLVSDASVELGRPIKDIVLTVPANWGSIERTEAKEAAKAVGLNATLLDEPVAAIVAYGYKARKDGLIGSFDYGAGSFDFSIVQVRDGCFNVIFSEGDDQEGGTDIDEDLMRSILDEIRGKYGIVPDSQQHPRFFADLRNAAIGIKHSMARRDSKKVFLTFEGRDFTIERSLQDFNKLVEPHAKHIMELCNKALAAKSLSWQDLDAVALIGGSTRIKAVVDMLKAESGLEPRQDLDPDKTVAYGAALHASQLLSEDNKVVVSSAGNVLPDPGIKVRGMVSKNIGVAAIDCKSGVERNFVMVEKGKSLPTEKVETFGTADPNAQSVSIKVLEGEKDAAVDACGQLDEFILDGLTPDQDNKERIQLTFSIEQSGILKVHALDTITGKEVKGSSQYEKAKKAS